MYLKIMDNGISGILMTHLFDYIKVLENGQFTFRFSEDIAPYVFQ